MENDAELGLHGGNTELGNENDGDVEGESDETILCGEGEAMCGIKRQKQVIDACIGAIYKANQQC